MAENLLTNWSSEIESLMLVPSDGGVFEVEVNGDLIYSKKDTGRHAEAGEVEDLFMKHIKQNQK